jgi:predicted MFS family arabinose efflux permease
VIAETGAFFAPMIAAATRWFDNNRSLAVSLVSAGMGIAPMTISPTARWLISTYDWRTAMMTVGVIAWGLLIPAALLVKQPPETAGSGNDYRWLYIGSVSVGLGAMAVALAFPPLPRRSRERLQPA